MPGFTGTFMFALYLILLTVSAVPLSIQDDDGISDDVDLVSFHLYPNPSNKNDVDVLVHGDLATIQNSRYDKSKSTIFIRVDSCKIERLIKPLTYLDVGKTSTANIIVIDWGELSGSTAIMPNITNLTALESLQLYRQAGNNVNVVGKRVQGFISFLKNNGQLQAGPSKIHLNAQSLGAHVMGMACAP